jgi:2-amino-4-hydroxy-6-hydroxymethyldihydropteridine diphosphokinase
MRSISLVALGSNTGFGDFDATECIHAAVEHITKRVGVIRGTSSIYRTPAFPAGSGPEFRNAAAVIATELSAPRILAELHAIEAAFGRERTERWGPRTLDLDLIAVGDTVLPDRETQSAWTHLPLEMQMQRVPQELLLPHPRLQDRAFVLVPLAEALAAAGLDWTHPVSGASVMQMLEALPKARRDEVHAMQ